MSEFPRLRIPKLERFGGAVDPSDVHRCPHEYGFESVRVMRLQPDDVIVVEVKDQGTDELRAWFTSQLEQWFPGHKAIVLDNGARLSVARPGGPVGGIGCWKPVEDGE